MRMWMKVRKGKLKSVNRNEEKIKKKAGNVKGEKAEQAQGRCDDDDDDEN